MAGIKPVHASSMNQRVNQQEQQSVPSSSQLTPPNPPDLVPSSGDTPPIYATKNSKRLNHASINDAISKYATGLIPFKSAKSAAPQFDSLALNQAEKAALAAVPADQIIDIATALRKSGIPITPAVLRDVMQFNDQSLSGPMEKLSRGRQNNVSRAKYGEFDAVFKSPRSTKG